MGSSLVLSKKARRELCKQLRAVEKVHARVHVRRNRWSARPLHGHLIKTTCKGLHRYCDCNFASQWPFIISCTVAFDSRAIQRPSGSDYSPSIFGQNLLLFWTPALKFITWHEIPYSPLNHFVKSPGAGSKWRLNDGVTHIGPVIGLFLGCVCWVQSVLCRPLHQHRYSNARCHPVWFPVFECLCLSKLSHLSAQTAFNSRCNEISL